MEMMSEEVKWLSQLTYQALDWMATLFVFFVGFMTLVVIVLFIIDVTQKKGRCSPKLPGYRALPTFVFSTG